jgi:AraC-like DNA-binding protein
MTLAIALWIAITKGSIVIWYFDGRIWFSISLILQNIIYSGCIIRLFRISKISIRSFFVKSDNPNMIWFRFLFCGYLFIWLLQAQFCVVWEVMKMSQYCAYTLSLYLLFAFVFFNAILYFRIEFPGIFMPRKKYEGSTLTGNEKEYYCSRLIELMENDKLYLDPDLTLGMLSGKLSIARSYLSQIINESFHVGFSDFINKYRTIESKSLLKIHNGKRNIIDIAFECGFNSKSAFNSAFKKHAGITPKEYQLQLRD